MTRFIASAIASLFLLLPAASAQLETGPLKIISGDVEHSFTVELANDPDEISTGLMNREQMADDAGMIFDFGQPRQANMWMKNTLIPLDMLFLDPEGTVLAVAHDAVPGSERRITPGVPVKGVLELNAGIAEELGIEPGDQVKHAIFGNLSE